MSSRGRALGGAVAVVAVLGGWAGPGAGPAAAYVCGFSIESPTGGAVLGSATASFRGPFVVKQGNAERVIEVAVTGPRGVTVRRTGADVGPAGRYDVGVGGLTLNGRYSARVKVSHSGTGLANCADNLLSDANRDTERTAEVAFKVSVRAQPPTDVRARFEAGPPRAAVVTWAKSPDPDVAGYRISRKVSGEGFSDVADVPAGTTSWTDGPFGDGGGTVTYGVSAARNGPDPGTTSEFSPVVAASVLDVPAAPPPPTTTTTATTLPASGGNGSPTTSTKPTTTPPTTSGFGPPASVPKSFVLGPAVAGTSSPNGAAPALRFPGGLIGPGPSLPSGTTFTPLGDDGVYQPNLPYGPQPEESQVGLVNESGDAAFVGAEGAEGEAGGNRRSPQLIFVAAGLLCSVVAAQVLWLRGQVMGGTAETDSALPIEPPPSSADAFAPPVSAGPVSGRPILVIRTDVGGP